MDDGGLKRTGRMRLSDVSNMPLMLHKFAICSSVFQFSRILVLSAVRRLLNMILVPVKLIN